MDIRPLANQILKALQEGKKEPRFSDFNVTYENFGEAVEYLKDESYIKGSKVLSSGQGNKVQIVWLNDAKITEKGYKLLDVL